MPETLEPPPWPFNSAVLNDMPICEKMKATLEFNLPEEELEYKEATQGVHWHNLICDLDEHLRLSIKHNSRNEYQPIRDWLNSKLVDRNLSLYD